MFLTLYGKDLVKKNRRAFKCFFICNLNAAAFLVRAAIKKKEKENGDVNIITEIINFSFYYFEE